jgi:hypothetical protein
MWLRPFLHAHGQTTERTLTMSSNTAFVPQSEVSQRVNVETAIPLVRQLTLETSTNSALTPEIATMRILGLLRHSVHPDLGEALGEFTEALRGRFVDVYMEQWKAAEEGRTI